MQKDLLKDIISMLAGKNAVPIVEILYSKGHVNEFVIAKKLKTVLITADVKFIQKTNFPYVKLFTLGF